LVVAVLRGEDHQKPRASGDDPSCGLPGQDLPAASQAVGVEDLFGELHSGVFHDMRKLQSPAAFRRRLRQTARFAMRWQAGEAVDEVAAEAQGQAAWPPA